MAGFPDLKLKKVKRKKIPKFGGKDFNKYLKENTGIVLQSLLDIIINGDNDKVKFEAIQLWLGKIVADKDAPKQLDGGNQTQVVVLPATQNSTGQASIALPELKTIEVEEVAEEPVDV